MGSEFIVNSLEDMCSLMCDNCLPKKTGKYYVIKTTKDGVVYKKYKCVDGWTKDKTECWKFTKQGAEQIAKRLNEKYAIPYKIHFNTLEVEEC